MASVTSTLPFQSYPGGGRTLIGRTTSDSCRSGYGLRFVRLTGLTTCAYCGLDLVSSYETWLGLALDHVVPSSVGRAAGMPSDWLNDYANLVLVCSACNTFDNRYRPSVPITRPVSLDEFFDLRDSIFRERKDGILRRHMQERLLYEREWLGPTRAE